MGLPGLPCPQVPGIGCPGPCASQKKLAEAPSLLLALVPCLSSIVLQLSDPSSDSHFSVTQLLLLAANWKCSRTDKLSTVTNRKSLTGDAPGFEPQNIRVNEPLKFRRLFYSLLERGEMTERGSGGCETLMSSGCETLRLTPTRGT